MVFIYKPFCAILYIGRSCGSPGGQASPPPPPPPRLPVGLPQRLRARMKKYCNVASPKTTPNCLGKYYALSGDGDHRYSLLLCDQLFTHIYGDHMPATSDHIAYFFYDFEVHTLETHNQCLDTLLLLFINSTPNV